MIQVSKMPEVCSTLYVGEPTKSKQVLRCARCGREFIPVLGPTGYPRYGETYVKKGMSLVDDDGKRFAFASTLEFQQKKKMIHLDCCCYTCAAVIKRINEKNLKANYEEEI